MDGQREQHLSGRLALDRPESSMASRSHDGESLLVTLPPEIQAIIASYVNASRISSNQTSEDLMLTSLL